MARTKRMPTVMKAGRQFTGVPSAQIQRSVFDRSHGHKTTFDAGRVIPIYWDEVVPGDTFTLRMTALARLTTPLKPLMDNLYLDSHFIFCPYRLVWTNFVKFMGEQDNPSDSINFTTPQYNGMPAAGFALGTVWDYLGLPTAGTPAVTASISFSALVIRAYFLMWNQWYRDENLQLSTPVPLGDGPDTTAQFAAGLLCRPRGKRPDYFTGCLPFLQKGPAVALPLGSTAPIQVAGGTDTTVAVFSTTAAANRDLRRDAGTDLVEVSSTTGGVPMVANLAGAAGSTINDFRQSVALQQFLEKDARAGTRYKELIWGHFRVMSDDARLDRTEYLGGGSTPIVFSPIAQQTQTGLTGGSIPLGNLGGVAAGIASGHGFTKSFTEHGIILGFVNVRADLTYSQGIEKMYFRSTRFDHFWPILEELGEQAVPNREIFATGAAADALVFGYQERNADYRYKLSKLTNLFRVSAAGTLEMWHASEKFGALPTLGATFIEDQTETVLDTRVAVPSEPDMVFDAFFDLRCARPMRVTGMPGLRRL